MMRVWWRAAAASDNEEAGLQTKQISFENVKTGSDNAGSMGGVYQTESIACTRLDTPPRPPHCISIYVSPACLE